MKKILSGLVALSLTTVVGNSVATNNLISAQRDAPSMNNNDKSQVETEVNTQTPKKSTITLVGINELTCKYNNFISTKTFMKDTSSTNNNDKSQVETEVNTQTPKKNTITLVEVSKFTINNFKSPD